MKKLLKWWQTRWETPRFRHIVLSIAWILFLAIGIALTWNTPGYGY